MQGEVSNGYVIGPFSAIPFPAYRISPLGVATGKYSGKKRLILDLSAPHHTGAIPSINDLINKEDCSLSYVTIDQAISKILTLGWGAQMCKVDITDAFKQVPVHPFSWYLIILTELILYVSCPSFINDPSLLHLYFLQLQQQLGAIGWQFHSHNSISTSFGLLPPILGRGSPAYTYVRVTATRGQPLVRVTATRGQPHVRVLVTRGHIPHKILVLEPQGPG